MNNDVTTLSGLESHLWEAANILRGPVDAADFKSYVFPLLFFKRLSDVHDEEYQAALAESGGDEEYAWFPQNYQFQVPENCHWSDVRAVTVNVGQAFAAWQERSCELRASMDLDQPYRLIFIPDHDPVPTLRDGGLDWSQVTAIKILGVEDTHG